MTDNKETEDYKAGVPVSMGMSFSELPMIKGKMRYFKFDHLPEHLQKRSRIFFDAATYMLEGCDSVVDVDEVARSLDRLLEAKDAYVRAFIPVVK